MQSNAHPRRILPLLIAALNVVTVGLAAPAMAQETPASDAAPPADAAPAESPASTEADPEAAGEAAEATPAATEEEPPAADAAQEAPPAEEAPAAEVTPAAEAPPNEATPAAPPAAEDDHPASGQEHTHMKADDADDAVAEVKGVCIEDRPCLQGAGFAVSPRVRVLGGYHFVFRDFANPAVHPTVGNNDGFFFDQLRLGFEGNWGGRLNFKVVADAVSFLPDEGQNDPLRNVYTTLRDAYVQWTPSDYVHVWAGQLYVPNNIENNTSRAALPFTQRSVASAGIRAGHGYATEGLGIGRQLGFMIGAAAAPIGPISLDYRFALANGNEQNIFGNDNKLPATYARLGAAYGELVQVGFGGYYNPTTVGEVPSLFNEAEFGGYADLKVDIVGFELVGQVMGRATAEDTALADGSDMYFAYGATAWLRVDEPLGFSLFGLSPALRVSYLDAHSVRDTDQFVEATFALRYEPLSGMPLAFVADATLIFEPSENNASQVENHRVTAMVVFDL